MGRDMGVHNSRNTVQRVKGLVNSSAIDWVLHVGDISYAHAHTHRTHRTRTQRHRTRGMLWAHGMIGTRMTMRATSTSMCGTSGSRGWTRCRPRCPTWWVPATTSSRACTRCVLSTRPTSPPTTTGSGTTHYNTRHAARDSHDTRPTNNRMEWCAGCPDPKVDRTRRCSTASTTRWPTSSP